MKKNFAGCMLSCFIFSVLLAACTTTGVKPPEKKEVKPPDKEPAYTKEERESLDIFTQILDIYESAESKQAAAQEAEVLYTRIITEYPGTPLAQESYWKLVTVALRDYSPPDFERAEAYYNEFLAKYPNSVLKNAVEQTLINKYVRYKEWERLLKFSTPAFMEFKEGGKKPMPQMVFMYSEAHYRLGNIIEAEEGYKAVLELYPTLSYGKRAKKRLEEIEQNEEKQ